jgi:AraC-like DNA-binding protein
MPIYMDIHQVPGAAALDLAEAHRKDMARQNDYRCKCITYWLDEIRGNAFCLIEAPDESSVVEMHRHSHGLIPNKIIEVKNELVESFLGRIHDPENATISDNGLKVFSDSAFRFIMVTDIIDPVLLRYSLGKEKANQLLDRQNSIIREEISVHCGREVEYAGRGFIASFTSAANALECALAIYEKMSKTDRALTGYKICINAGEPVSKSAKLFGDAIQMARNLCTIARSQIVVASVVKDLLARDYFQKYQKKILCLSRQEEAQLESLFNLLEETWQDPDFSVIEFCKRMSMSKSQLYRKTISLWELAPNQLLKEYRLDKALEILNSRSANISQTTFDAGFTSASYFTKCFKKKFGLLPANYLSSLQ